MKTAAKLLSFLFFGVVSATLAIGQELRTPVICHEIGPEYGGQLTFQTIVRIVGPSKERSLEASFSGKDTNVTLLEFDAESLETGERFHCLTEPLRSENLSGNGDFVYLLLGWRSSQGVLESRIRAKCDRDSALNRLLVEAGPGNVYVHSLIPTSATKAFHSGNPGKDAVMNLAATLPEANPKTLRQVTSCLLRSVGGTYSGSKDDDPPRSWMRETITTVLKGLPQRNSLERLRINGLMAHWNPKEYGLAFLQTVPVLVRDLRPSNYDAAAVPLDRDVSDDLSFLRWLDLTTGVDPSKVFELYWKYPEVRHGVALGNIGKPSLENQRKMLSFKDDPNIGRRASALNYLRGWYAEWDKTVQVRWDESLPGAFEDQPGADVIDNEEALWVYWISKIGPPIKP